MIKYNKVYSIQYNLSINTCEFETIKVSKKNIIREDNKYFYVIDDSNSNEYNHKEQFLDKYFMLDIDWFYKRDRTYINEYIFWWWFCSTREYDKYIIYTFDIEIAKVIINAYYNSVELLKKRVDSEIWTEEETMFNLLTAE